MWSITRSLTQAWTRCSLWKRSLLLFVAPCIAIQIAFVSSLWHEFQFRQRIQANGSYILGPSFLPGSLETQLNSSIGPATTELLAPIVELYRTDPTARDLDDIANLPRLQALSIKGGQPGAARLGRLGSLSQLKTLELLDVNLDEQSLIGLSNCPSLCRIKLKGKVTPEALEPLKHCESLCELYLDRMEDTPRESSFTGLHLAAIAKIPHLKHLQIHAGEIDDTELLGLAYARELETLAVYELQLHTNAINVLGRLPRLRQLVIEPFDAESVDLLCGPRPLKGFPALKAFSITNSRISPAFIAGLAKLPKLEALSFNECRVDKVVAELGELPKLKFLDLSATDVQSSPYRKIGHLNASSDCDIFVDELIHPSPDPESDLSIYHAGYFNQPEWPEVCEQPSCCCCFF